MVSRWSCRAHFQNALPIGSCQERQRITTNILRITDILAEISADCNIGHWIIRKNVLTSSKRSITFYCLINRQYIASTSRVRPLVYTRIHGRLGLRIAVKERDFCSPNPSRSAEAHQASYSVGTLGCFPGIKRREREVNHSPPSIAEVKNKWGCTSASPIWCG